MRKKVALVTGASSGLGRAFAEKISSTGGVDEIWLIARRKERLEALADSLSGRGRVLAFDLLEESSFAAVEALLSKEKPDISFLINNAGRGKAALFAEEKPDEAADMVRLNGEVPVRLTGLCLPYMSSSSGIINVCSAASFLPIPGLAVYSASKSFLLSFSRSLHRELKGRGIAVTALCSYWIGDTEFMEKAGVRNRPLGLLSAADVAEKGLRDNRKGKEISLPGIMGKLTRLGTVLFPLSWLLFLKKIFRA